MKMKIFADTQKRLEYVHSSRKLFACKMTAEEVTLEEEVCRHRSGRGATTHLFIVTQLSVMQ